MVTPLIDPILSRTEDSKSFQDLHSALSKGTLALHEVINDLVHTEGAPEVHTAMSNLEWLATQDSALALLLMSGLYGVADRLLAHEICDAVELWIEAEGSEQLARELEIHARRGSLNPSKVSDWIASIDARETER